MVTTVFGEQRDAVCNVLGIVDYSEKSDLEEFC